MIFDMTTLNRKKYQRAMNKFVRDMNKNIENDWLWDGRFVIRQKQYHFKPFADKSGAEFFVLLSCVDTKTGEERTAWFNNFDFGWQIWMWVNDTIIHDFKVWDEDPNPRVQAILEGRSPTSSL